MPITVPYDEGIVTFKFQGQNFETHGASVNEVFAYGYPGQCDRGCGCSADRPNHSFTGCRGPFCNSAGVPIGRYTITSTWRTPRSWVSSEMHQMEVIIEKRPYTGRCAGVNMLFKGRRLGAKRVKKTDVF